MVEVYLYDARPMFPFLIYLLLGSVSIFPMNRVTKVTGLRLVIRTATMVPWFRPFRLAHNVQ